MDRHSIGRSDFEKISHQGRIRRFQQDSFWQSSPGEMYQTLSKVAFGTSDQDIIDSTFSRRQRLETRIGIINLIADIKQLAPYRTEFILNPHGVKGIAEKYLLGKSGRKFDNPVDGEFTPFGLIFYLDEIDFIKVDTRSDISGTVLHGSSDHPALKDRVAIIKKRKASADQLSNIREHEHLHILYNSFFQERGELYGENTVARQMIARHLQAKSENKAFHEELKGYHLHVNKMRREFLERAKNEAIAYLFGDNQANYYYFEPLRQLGGKHFVKDLEKIKGKLFEQTDMTPQEKAAVYGVYKEAFSHYLQQVREYQWIASRLRRQAILFPPNITINIQVEGERINEKQAEALLLVTAPEDAKRLARKFGVNPRIVRQVIEGSDSVMAEKLLDNARTHSTFSYDSLMNDTMRIHPKDALPAFMEIINSADDSSATNWSYVEASTKAIENTLFAYYSTMTQDELLEIRKSLASIFTKKPHDRKGRPSLICARTKADEIIGRIDREYLFGDAFAFEMGADPAGTLPTYQDAMTKTQTLVGKGQIAVDAFLSFEDILVLNDKPEGKRLLAEIFDITDKPEIALWILDRLASNSFYLPDDITTLLKKVEKLPKGHISEFRL